MNDRLRKKDCDKLYRQEEAFLKKNYPEPSIKMQERIAKYVPEKLNETLCKAFCKSFQLILEKGNGVIEVTYHKEKMQEDFKVDQYAMEVRKGSSVSNTLHRKAVKGNLVNQLLTTVEGVGMGVIGMGIPDIPVFLGVLLKSIYQIALTYGYSYDSEEEQIFIMKLVETALLHQQDLEEQNRELNHWIEERSAFQIAKEEQIRRTADALAKEMLYLKFIQGIPVVGVVGGISDITCQKKITDFALIKYKRRYLSDKKSLLPSYAER